MARELLTANFKFPDWIGMLNLAEGRIGRFVAAQIQTNRGMMFDQEGAHNGKAKWAPLKYRSGQILSLSGALRKSWSPSNPDGTPGPGGIVQIRGTIKDQDIVVGSALAYAPMMNYGTAGLPGGVLKPKKKDRLYFKVGGKWVSAKEVTIPARRMDEWSDGDMEELTETLTNFLQKVLNGG